MSRKEHLEWAKGRALGYLDRGDANGALASMMSDLKKHPELADHVGIELGMMLALTGLSSPSEVKRHIEGYN